MFILALEVLFELIKNNADIRGITIFNHTFLYTAFADDSTFFLNDLLSVKNLIDTFTVFSLFSGLKANFSKCEIAGLGSLKGVLEAARILKSINLTTDTIKIVGVHFSYNLTLKVQNNFLDTVKSIQQVLLFWSCIMLSLEEGIIILKTIAIAISEIVYLTYLTSIPNSLIEELQKVQKTFIWYSSHPKISHKNYTATLNRSFLHEFKYNKNITNFEMKLKKQKKILFRPTQIYVNI